MKNIFEIFKKKEEKEGVDYGSLQGLETQEGAILRRFPNRDETLLTRRGMGQVKVNRLGNIVGGKKNG